MRARSTWQSEKSETPRQAATSRKADIYTMNQEHAQPSVTDYENGNPDSWAETPVSDEKSSVKAEYDGDHVKRNEVGFGEFRDDTWKHKDSDQWNGKGKYDNAKLAAERRAMACERLARATLRTADAKLIEGAAIDLMALPDKSIVAMLKRLDAVSPDALPNQAKFKRALACTKLAARMIGASATPASVEKLGSVMMTIDDPTLKAIIRTIASARVAQEEQQDDQGKTSQTKVSQKSDEDDKSEGQTSQVLQTSQKSEDDDKAEGQTSQEQQDDESAVAQEQEQEPEEEMVSQEQEAQGLNAEEMAMLDSMLNADACAPAAPGAVPAAPAAPAPAAPADDLSALFSGAPAAPAAMPMMASDISFDDDDEAPATPQMAADLDSIFADDSEVQAQRQIQAANREASAREGGYAGRVASANAGAKKLGTVQKTTGKVSVDKALEALWERP